MSDFRILLPESPDDDFISELDWDGNEGIWTLSEREMGLGKSWSLGMAPSIKQLTSIMQFFRLNPDYPPESLRTLSPDELTRLHHETSPTISIYAVPCETCGQHWDIFRWDPELQLWLSYGRNCDFQWRRGRILTHEEVIRLGQARGLEEDVLRPPQAARRLTSDDIDEDVSRSPVSQ